MASPFLFTQRAPRRKGVLPAIRQGGGLENFPIPDGFQLLTGADGQFLRGADGAYLYGEVQ